MHYTEFFKHLWQDYLAVTPQAQAIHELFTGRGETVVNDHVAFRTLSESAIALPKLETVLADLGYEPYGDFRFEQKKLNAKSYRHKLEADAPKIFLSEIQVAELPDTIATVLRGLSAQIPANLALSPELFWCGRLWHCPSFEDYQALASASEYAAWLATMGLRANHFTVSINHLKTLGAIADVNQLLKDKGFALNTSGGEIKGSPAVKLEQSSTLADTIELTFADGSSHRVPSCFYEFAERHPLANGQLFDGFIEGNADKIFDSTNR